MNKCSSVTNFYQVVSSVQTIQVHYVTVVSDKVFTYFFKSLFSSSMFQYLSQTPSILNPECSFMVTNVVFSKGIVRSRSMWSAGAPLLWSAHATEFCARKKERNNRLYTQKRSVKMPLLHSSTGV